MRPDVVGGHDSCPDNPCLSPHHHKLFEKDGSKRIFIDNLRRLLEIPGN